MSHQNEPNLAADGVPGQQPALECPFSIHLASEQRMPECKFWLALNTQGSLHPRELLAKKQMSARLTAAADQGTVVPGPLLLTDADGNAASYLFLIPPPENGDNTGDKWTSEIVEMLRAWAPHSLGLYLANRELVEENVTQLMLMLLPALFTQSPCRKVYLFTGQLGTNFLLRLSLDVRTQLKALGLDVDVYH